MLGKGSAMTLYHPTLKFIFKKQNFLSAFEVPETFLKSFISQFV